MSATSEEVAAQAEQLQGSISFFRIENVGRDASMARSTAHHASITHLNPKKIGDRANVKKRVGGSKPAQSSAPKASNGAANGSGGYALNLNGGPDSHDAEFEKY